MDKPVEVLPAVQTGLVAVQENQVERIDGLHDLAECLFRQVQEVREIFLYNYNRGIRFQEMGPHDGPFDFKLNQLNEKVTELRGLVNGIPRAAQFGADMAPGPDDVVVDEYQVTDGVPRLTHRRELGNG